MLNIVVLVSGGGTNLGALLKAEQEGKIQGGKISLVLSSSPTAYALERAKSHNVLTQVVDRKAINNPAEFDRQIFHALQEAKADLIILAGFMYILSSKITEEYAYKIINVHPSLIPSFCGPGFYGLHVHQAALDYGVKLTGATVHFVNEVADGGAIILQKSVAIETGDTPEILQKRVMERAEWKLLPQAASLFCQGKLEIINDKVHIKSEDGKR